MRTPSDYIDPHNHTVIHEYMRDKHGVDLVVGDEVECDGKFRGVIVTFYHQTPSIGVDVGNEAGGSDCYGTCPTNTGHWYYCSEVEKVKNIFIEGDDDDDTV